MLTVKTADFHIPWRMLYTHPTGDACRRRQHFEPSGFWGYQHVIEQYPAPYPGNDQLYARGGKLGFGAAMHERIDAEFKVDYFKRHRDFIQSSADVLTYAEWTKIAGLERVFRRSVRAASNLLPLSCGSRGLDHRPSLVPATLQLADGKIDAAGASACQKQIRAEPAAHLHQCLPGGQLGTLCGKTSLLRPNSSIKVPFASSGRRLRCRRCSRANSAIASSPHSCNAPDHHRKPAWFCAISRERCGSTTIRLG